MATCGVGFAVLFSMVATFTYANFYLAAPPFSLGPAQLGSVFVIYLLGVAATPVATRLALRFGRRRTVLLAAAAASGGLLLTLVPWLPAIIVGLAFAAAGIFTEQVLSLGYVAAAARRSRSTAVGLYVTCYYVGGSLGRRPASQHLASSWLARLRRAGTRRAGRSHAGHAGRLAAPCGFTFGRRPPTLTQQRQRSLQA